MGRRDWILFFVNKELLLLPTGKADRQLLERERGQRSLQPTSSSSSSSPFFAPPFFAPFSRSLISRDESSSLRTMLAISPPLHSKKTQSANALTASCVHAEWRARETFTSIPWRGGEKASLKAPPLFAGKLLCIFCAATFRSLSLFPPRMA